MRNLQFQTPVNCRCGVQVRSARTMRGISRRTDASAGLPHQQMNGKALHSSIPSSSPIIGISRAKQYDLGIGRECENRQACVSGRATCACQHAGRMACIASTH